jgi:hypothetical protein
VFLDLTLGREYYADEDAQGQETRSKRKIWQRLPSIARFLRGRKRVLLLGNIPARKIVWMVK